MLLQSVASLPGPGRLRQGCRMQSLTVITTTPNRLLTKNLVSGESYAKTSKLVAAESRQFATLKQLKRLLAKLRSEPNSCVIRGELRPDAPTPLRRRKEAFSDEARAWVMLDIDDFSLPKSLRSYPYTQEHLDVLRKRLPPEFQNASFVWQASASAGMDVRRMKVHLWFLLDAPLTAAQLRSWFNSDYMKPARDIVDTSTMRCVQPHYTADPIGGPVGKRLGIFKGKDKRVTTPEDIASLEPEPAAVELSKRPKGCADVSQAQIDGCMKAAVKRSKALLAECSVAYQDAYKVGALLGPAVALEFWNDKAHGHEADTWYARVEALATKWGRRFAKLPDTKHDDATYAARVHEGVVWGMANERARLAQHSERALTEARTRTQELQGRLLAKLMRNAGSEKVLQEVGQQLGRYAHVIGRDELLASLQQYSGLSEQQCEAAIEGADEVDVSAWREGLLFKGELIEATDANIIAVYRRYPGFAESFEYNVRAQVMEATDANVLGLAAGPVDIDKLPGLLAAWLCSIGMRRVSMAAAFNVFRTLTLTEYDPLLRALPEALLPAAEAKARLKELKPRLHKWLHRYLGATGDKDYVRSVASKTLIAAVARAVNPGAEVHTMLVLMGAQGIGKTSAIKALASIVDGGYKELLDMRDKDCLLSMQASVLVEMSELRALRSSAEEFAKAFFSRGTDHVRAPYARSSQALARRMVFIGTTNDDAFLSDHENRRYWPVWCDGGSLMRRKDALVLWREAALRFAAGETWWLDTVEEQELQRAATASVREENMLEHVLRKQLKRQDSVSFMDAARLVYPSTTEAYRNSRAIARALIALGWTRKRSAKANKWVRVP